MISEVRSVIRRLGVAGESAIRAETGLPASHIHEALEFLLSHGYVREMYCPVDPAGCSVGPALEPGPGNSHGPASTAPKAPNAPRAVHCAACPMQAGCAPGLPGATASVVGGASTDPARIRVFELT